MPTEIFIDLESSGLSWEGDRLATKHEFDLADRCVGSIFEALEIGEEVKLAEGIFKLDESDFPELEDMQAYA